MLWVEKFFGKTWVDQMTEQTNNLEDNLPMVNYIMLHRIYDLLTVMANAADPEKTSKVIEFHEQGYLLGPAPSFTPSEE
jgi:hypothetical protein